MIFHRLFIYSTFFIATLSAIALFSSTAAASGEQAAIAEQIKGPHGGKLLFDDSGLALEITIYEQGMAPEMRIYGYENAQSGEANHDDDRDTDQQLQPLSPTALTVKATLTRLGGAVDQLSFSAEQDYLVSNSEVTEPHSFDVAITANKGDLRAQWQYDNYEGRTQISQRQQQLAGIRTERAGPATLAFVDTLFGVIAPVQDKVFRINAAYPGLVEVVHVGVGERVSKGQKLLTLRNTQTLQSYVINSPAAGQVTARHVNSGDRANLGTLLEVTDLSTVWVELSAFPESIEKLQLGQKVTVYDLHHHQLAQSTISYIAPAMTGGHIARARATIDNLSGHWRPGMHLKADVETERRDAALAIRNSALQTFRDMPVVFARFGERFEVRMVELGATTGEFSEVLGGLAAGTEYVIDNSFLIKADVLKDGASHDH